MNKFIKDSLQSGSLLTEHKTKVTELTLEIRVNIIS